MRSFLKANGCKRVAAYNSLDKDITPFLPSHECCSHCALSCECGADICTIQLQPYESTPVSLLSNEVQVPLSLRIVSETDKKALAESLEELKTEFSSNRGISAFGNTACHGFSSQLVSDVVNNCHKIFNVTDILTYVPVFSKDHAVRILEVLSEFFDDFSDTVLTDLSMSNQCDRDHLVSIEELIASSEYVDDIFEDSLDLDFIE